MADHVHALRQQVSRVRRAPGQWFMGLLEARTQRLRVAQHRRDLSRQRAAWESAAQRRPMIAIDLVHSMSDLIAGEPIVRYMRRQHPQAWLIWCVREVYADLVKDHPEIDGIVALRGAAERDRLIASGLFEHVVSLNGAGCSDPDEPLNRLPPATDADAGLGRSRLAGLCQGAGLAMLNDRPRLAVHPRWRVEADRLGLLDAFVVIHGRCRSPERDWTMEGWGAVVRHLRRCGVAVIEVGSRPVLAPLGSCVRNLCGISPALAAEVIRRAELFVGVESGPAQIANAVGTQGVILMGRPRGMARQMPFTGRFADPAEASLLIADGALSSLPPQCVIDAIDERLAMVRRRSLVSDALPSN